MSNLLHELVKIIEKMKQWCESGNFNIPTEIKVMYDTKLNKAKSNVKYTNQFDYENLLGWDFMFNKWFEEVKSKIE